MNRIYRLIWNHTLGALVPVSEIVRAKGGGVTRRRGVVSLRLSPLGGALVLALSLSPTLALAQRPLAVIEAQEALPLRAARQASVVPPPATATVTTTAIATATATTTPSVMPSDVVAPPSRPLPTGGQVVSGQVGFTQDGHTLTIDQGSQKAIIDWQSFDIGSGNTVTFHQPGRDSVALNRVLGSDPSAIYGHLEANGQVFLVNPYGVYFAAGAQVNVGGLVASTLNLSDDDFLQGRYHFGGSSSAGVRNDGSMRAAQGGYVAMIGRRTNNTGSLSTPGGATALGAGSSVSLTLAGQELVSFQVDGAALGALAANGGVIAADGGRVILSAQAKDALLQTVVNNQGRIQAQTVQSHGGTIDLLGGDAGTVQVAGTLDASATTGDGGAIETSGAHVKVADGAVITTAAGRGSVGSWLIDPQDFTIAASGGDISGATLSANLGNNGIIIQSSSGGTSGAGDILVNDSVNWSAHTLTLHADRNIVVNAAMNASKTAGLKLQYGQATTDGKVGGVAADYSVNAPINLASTGSFATQLGSAGTKIDYTILTSLGAPGSVTGADLQGINGGLAGHYALGSDIDASATATWNSGAGFAPIGGSFSTAFTGIFDGLGHTITGLTIDRPSTDSVGLFGFVGRNAAVRNIGLLSESVAGNSSVGGLAGANYVGSSINNAYATGSVVGRGGYVGGLVGSNSGGVITNVYATDSVQGVAAVGGLVGSNYGGIITNAYATGSVAGSTNVGGLIGESNNAGALYGGVAAIRNVYATGKITGINNVGGLVGWNAGSSSIDNAYATGSVTGSRNIGGLAGENTAAIANAYAIGKVVGSSAVGGLVGDNENETSSTGAITNGYWDATTTGQSVGVGASKGTVTGGGALTTAQLAAALPTGFDAGVWGNGDNQTTPYLLANASFDTVSGSVILGSDTSATPTAYNVILTLDQLQHINSTGLAAINYVLGTDIDASATISWNGGAGFDPIGSSSAWFNGVFDGLGHTIIGLIINRPDSDNVALFGMVGGTVRNIGVIGGSVTGHDYVAGLVGENILGTVSNAYSTSIVNGFDTVGGLVGMSDGTIDNAYATGSVSGWSWVGGLVGANEAYEDEGIVSNAYATGTVSGAGYVGGLIGWNAGGTISNAYAAGSVSGTSNVGGLIGINTGSGANTSSTITNGYWDIETTGQSAGIGILSGTPNPVITGGGGLTTAQLAAALPTGFDASVWGNGDNQTTPYLLANASFDTVSGSVFLGSDTSATPTRYNVILTLDQLQHINSAGLAVNYVLGTDIDASATFSWNGGAGFDPIGSNRTYFNYFNGTFDGLGHTINGLIINRPNSDNVGLFGVLGGIVRNVGLVGGSITGHDDVGGLVGDNILGTVSNAYTTSTISGLDCVGGLVGVNEGTIGNAYATGRVSGSGWVGGLAGLNVKGTVSNVYATGSVGGGGIVGGLIGWNNGGTVSNAYATGSVSGTSNVGGLIGINSDLGGNVSTITNGYWDIDTTRQSVGVGSNQGTVSSGGGLTTAQLAAALPSGFDASTWGNGDNQTTPYLLANASFDTVSGSVLLGSDTRATPIRYNVILTLEQLQNINSTGLGANYVLGTNIDASATINWNGGAGFDPLGSYHHYDYFFNGIFDGLGHTIIGLTINRLDNDSVGLFRAVGTNGSVHNIGLEGGSVSGGGIVGSLIGSNRGTISNVYATGSASGINSSAGVGGLVGWNLGSISDAYATGDVSGTDNVGGLVGQNFISGIISDAYATGNVSGTGGVGGLVGANNGSNTIVRNAYATGSVSSVTDVGGNSDVGGLVGINYRGTIDNVYATGSVTGTSYNVGGLVGANWDGSISNAYATGRVTSAYYNVGGLVGDNFITNGGTASTITNGYWDIDTTDQSVGVGSNRGTVTGGGGLTTAQLAAALPTGFDASVWGNGDNQTTPYLLANASFDTVSGSVLLGSDTSATPKAYNVVLTLDQLQHINSTGLAVNYVLGTNIDASATASWNDGAGFASIGYGTNSATSFRGTFEGLGHTISGLTIDRPGTIDVGLFGSVFGGIVRNVGLLGGSVSGGSEVGELIGANYGGSVSNAYATGSVSGTRDVGGLAGFSNGTIANAYAAGSVSGSSNIGGLVGSAFDGAITNAYATGNVTGSGRDVGGLLGGDSNGSIIRNAYATGSVSGGSAVGGLVGQQDESGEIADAYATGSVRGTIDVGGLIGQNLNGSSITNVYATGSVSGTSNVGGLVGINSDFGVGNVSTITNGYWDIDTTGQSVGVGSNQSLVTGGGGLTTAQMHQRSSFVGFDFDTPEWVIYEGHTAPLLKAFLTDLTVDSDDQTQTYTGGTFTLSNPRFSVSGADTSGHLFGLDDPYDGAVNVGTYAADLWSDQQGYFITVVNSRLTIAPAVSGLVAQSVDEKSSGGTQVTLDVPHLQIAGSATGEDSSASQSIGVVPAQTLTSAPR